MAKENERYSKPGDGLEVAQTPEQVALVEAQNALRQYDHLRELIQEAVKNPPFRLRVSALLNLNRLAIERLHPQAGAYRAVPITIGGGSKHVPPPSEEVARHVDDMVDYVNSNGDKSALHLAAYVMWRLNWIHPFYDGNGRTTRAASYLVLCARLGYELPGTTAIPEMIASQKQPYYDALDEADASWATGRLEVGVMESLLSGALATQLATVVTEAQSGRRGGSASAQIPPGIRGTLGPNVAPAAQRETRKTGFARLPRWQRILSVAGAVAVAVVTAAWQLVLNWDHPRVAQIRQRLFEGEPPQVSPADAIAPQTSGDSSRSD